MAVEMGIIAPHAPSMIFEDQAPEYQKEAIQGMKTVAKIIDEINPDVALLVSCHWMTTFDHYVDASEYHKGKCTSPENPALIHKVPYSYPGDRELGVKLAEAGQKAGIPVVELNDPEYDWDYGTLVPLRYLIPKENIPVINMPVVMCSTLDECYLWGQVIRDVVEQMGRKAIMIASGALSHNLVRGREIMPTLAEQAMNNQFVSLLEKGDLDTAWNMLPQFGHLAKVESGGRHLATLLGFLKGGSYDYGYYGFCQSSASGNVVVTLRRKS